MFGFTVIRDESFSTVSSGVSNVLLDSVETTLLRALEIWGQYIEAPLANITLNLQIEEFADNTLAAAGPQFVSFGGGDFQDLVNLELTTNSDIDVTSILDSDADVIIDLSSLSSGGFFIDNTSAPNPAGLNFNQSDLLTVLLHELGHVFGFITDPELDTPFGSFVTEINNEFFFTGANAVAQFGGNVPLDVATFTVNGQQVTIGDGHLRENSALGPDLLSPILTTGIRAHINPLHIAILQDLGITAVTASSGADDLFGFELTDDNLSGLAGNDDLSGLSGDDTLEGGTGSDTLNGGTGFDTAVYAGNLADFTVIENPFSGTATVIDNNLVDGNEGFDNLTSIERLQFADGVIDLANPDNEQPDDFGDSFNNNPGSIVVDDVAVSGELEVNDDNDVFAIQLVAGTSYEFTVGLGTLPDSILALRDATGTIVAINDDFGGTRASQVTFTAQSSGTFFLDVNSFNNASSGTYTLSATEIVISAPTTGDDMLEGTSGTDVIDGLAGNDVINGLAGLDTISGGAGNDTLNGGDGIDTVNGGAGNDRFLIAGTDFGDNIDGGAGVDILDLRNFTFDGYIVNLEAQTTRETTTGGPVTTIVNVENVIGTNLIDTITGDAGDNSISGLGGSDVIEGGAGNDTINGGLGQDIIDGGAGNDRIIIVNDDSSDQIDGGDEIDTLDLNTDVSGAYVVDLSLGTAQQTGSTFAHVLINIENVTGTNLNDAITGDAGVNVLDGGAGIDTLNGGDGNDTLIGGAQNDLLNGGEGNDILLGGLGVDILNGGEGNDLVLGGNRNDQLFGEAGNDRTFGGNGDDTADGGVGDDIVRGGDNNDVLLGGTGNDVVFGGTGQDSLSGNDGDDALDGRGGFDILSGGAGNDVITGGANADQFVFEDGFGEDIITDFAATSNPERIFLTSVSEFTDFADLSANHLSQVGANVVIDDNAGNTITLVGVDLADIDANDFVFDTAILV